jgi:UDP-N-acetylglucosamine acyltransferase
VTAGRDPLTYAGVNIVGLKRRGFTNEQITLIQDTYRIVFQSKLNTTNAIAKILETIPATAERDFIVTFIKSSDRGIIKGYA